MGFGQFAATTQFFLYGRRHFTAKGWERASSRYTGKPVESIDLSGKCFVVTGANSGCGLELSRYLAGRGARLYMVCRSRERAEKAREEVTRLTGNPNVFTLLADVGLAADVRDISATLATREPAGLDGLVCNAGALLADRTLTNEGFETTFAAHLLHGAYLLSACLLPLLQRSDSGGRIIFVASGGMYNTRFPGWAQAAATEPDFSKSYNGQLAYAYAKRGQVLLAERLAAKHPGMRIVSCHPGWVDTPGVEAAYGAGRAALQPMRTLWQGIEGMAWLCAADAEEIKSGEFYLDRSPQVKHIAGPFFTEGSFTKNTPEEVDEMMAKLEAATTLEPLSAPAQEIAIE